MNNEFGKCDICGKDAYLNITCFYYPINCECCLSKDEQGQNRHFILIKHCDKCVPKIPEEINPELRTINGLYYRPKIFNIKPIYIKGKFFE